MMVPMKVYVKRGCPWCIDAVAWLRGKGYHFEEIDVIGDRAAFDRMRAISGQSRAPTLEMPDGKVLADFDVRQLEVFLRARGITPP